MKIAVLLSLASLPDSAAFLPSFKGGGVSREDSSRPWRLEYFDYKAQEMQLYTDSFPYPPELKHYRSWPEVEAENGDSDVQSFESRYQGLTKPSKAALALAVMIGVGMVAASPEMDYSSVTLPGSWLESLQHGIGPIFEEKLPLVSFEISYKAGELRQKAGMQDVDLHSQGIFAANELQASFETFASVAASKMEALKSLAQALQNSFIQTESSLFFKGMAMTDFFRETIASKTQQFQGLWEDSLQQVKSSIADPAVMQLSKSRAAIGIWQHDTDMQMLRQGTEIHNRIVATWGAKIEDDIAIPVQQGWTAFQDSFHVEVTREISDAEAKFKEVEVLVQEQKTGIEKWNNMLQSTVPEELFRNQNELDSKANDLRVLVAAEIVRIISSLTEWTRSNTIEVLARAEELPVRIMNAAEMRTNEGQALLCMELTHLSTQIAENLREWQSSTDAQVLEGRIELAKRYNDALTELEEILQTIFVQIALVSDSIAIGVAAGKDSMKTYQDEMDLRMLNDEATLRDAFVRERAIIEEVLDSKFVYARNGIVNPLMLTNREFWASFETHLHHDLNLVRGSIEESVSNVKACWDSSTDSFGTTVVPKGDHRADGFFEGSKTSILEGATKAKEFLKHKADEVHASTVPEAIKSWSTSSKAAISATSAKLFSGIATFCQLLEDVIVTKYVAIQNDVIPAASGTLKGIAANAEHLSRGEFESAKMLAASVAETGNDITVDAIPRASDTMSTAEAAVPTSVQQTSSVEARSALVQQTTALTGASITDQYDRLQKSLFEGFNQN